jgi:predicted ATP-dependent endonuclease of OLD family
MTIKKIDIENFTLFDKACFEFSGTLNVIIGKNSTGKTHLMKLLNAISKAYEIADNLEKNQSKFSIPLTKELLKNFMVDRVGKLSSRVKGHSHSKIDLYNYLGQSISFEFTNKQEEVSITSYVKNLLDISSIYVPTKEILTMYNGFISRYLEGELNIEKIYFDMAVKLGIPLKNGALNSQSLIEPIEKMMQGKIVFDPTKEQFYLQQKGIGKLEIGLVAEGYRKIGQILYLIGNGVLTDNSILFWDEPEINLNPAYSEHISEMLVELSKNTQIFIATHDYFILKYLDLTAKAANVEIKFFSLYKTKETDKFVQFESSDSLDDIEQNPIMQEFEAVYKRLSETFYA